jgi:hypothetical protein
VKAKVHAVGVGGARCGAGIGRRANEELFLSANNERVTCRRCRRILAQWRR